MVKKFYLSSKIVKLYKIFFIRKNLYLGDVLLSSTCKLLTGQWWVIIEISIYLIAQKKEAEKEACQGPS